MRPRQLFLMIFFLSSLFSHHRRHIFSCTNNIIIIVHSHSLLLSFIHIRSFHSHYHHYFFLNLTNSPRKSLLSTFTLYWGLFLKQVVVINSRGKVEGGYYTFKETVVVCQVDWVRRVRIIVVNSFYLIWPTLLVNHCCPPSLCIEACSWNRW